MTVILFPYDSYYYYSVASLPRSRPQTSGVHPRSTILWNIAPPCFLRSTADAPEKQSYLHSVDTTSLTNGLFGESWTNMLVHAVARDTLKICELQNRIFGERCNSPLLQNNHVPQKSYMSDQDRYCSRVSYTCCTKYERTKYSRFLSTLLYEDHY